MKKIGLASIVLLLAACSGQGTALPPTTAARPTQAVTMTTPSVCTGIGDSITFGVFIADKTQTYADIVAAQRGCSLQNLAVSGYTSCDMMQKELPKVDPRASLVILNAGTNDVWHWVAHGIPLANGATCYRRMVASLRRLLPAATIAFLNVRDWQSMTGTDTPAYEEILNQWDDLVYREYRATPNSVFVNLRRDPTMYNVADWFSPDYVHPQVSGHRLIAQRVLAALGKE